MLKWKYISHKLIRKYYLKYINNFNSINTFKLSQKNKKNKNDKNNKIRENIIANIINDKIPQNYYIVSVKWNNLKQSLFNYLNNLNHKTITNMKCNTKAGRKYNYDFDIELTYNDLSKINYQIEFKYNATNIKHTPQFVSPMKPSQYLNNSYEEYFYHNYLPQLAHFTNFKIPTKLDYLNQIHTTNPNCMELYQQLYYSGCKQSTKFSNDPHAIEFYKLSKQISKKSINDFITITNLDTHKLSNYLLKTQLNKIYMFYHNNTFIPQHIDNNNYLIDTVIKNPKKNRYECITKNKQKLNVLLRWKNGNGIAFPAFQIS
jgi:hypothetical protein